MTKEERANRYAYELMLTVKQEHKLGNVHGAMNGYIAGYEECESIKDSELAELKENNKELLRIIETYKHLNEEQSMMIEEILNNVSNR